jgi:hypothetical protein
MRKRSLARTCASAPLRPGECGTPEKVAEAPGFEPGSADPKSAVLPLHHASVRSPNTGNCPHQDSTAAWALALPCSPGDLRADPTSEVTHTLTPRRSPGLAGVERQGTVSPPYRRQAGPPSGETPRHGRPPGRAGTPGYSRGTGGEARPGSPGPRACTGSGPSLPRRRPLRPCRSRGPARGLARDRPAAASGAVLPSPPRPLHHARSPPTVRP